jgi:hypothetical protein
VITYTLDEWADLSTMIEGLREDELAVFTPASLLSELEENRDVCGGNVIDYDSGRAKLRDEPPELLAAFCAGKADWVEVAKETFVLALKK